MTPDKAWMSCLAVVALGFVSGAGGATERAEPAAWTQWGGPGRDFRVPAVELAESWPAEGPPVVWSRLLGEGESAILAAEGRLYTTYRDGSQEVIACLDATSGKTLWERRYDEKPLKGHIANYGEGPRSTPLLVGDRLFAIGITGRLHVLDKRTGELLWKRSMWDPGFEGKGLGFGYCSSPIAYDDTVIVPFGGPTDAGFVALSQADGAARWRTGGFQNSYSSPAIRRIDGKTMLVSFVVEGLIGLDPADGTLLWQYEHANQWGHNITMPGQAGADTLFLSSPQVGAHGIRVSAGKHAWSVDELWTNRRVQFYHGTAITDGDWIYGASGTSVGFLVAVNMRTGEFGWRERGYANATLVASGDKLVALDEEGVLYLLTATPESLTLHAKSQLLAGPAWAVPTLVGTRLYARDNERIVAVDLGPGAVQTPSTRRDNSTPSASMP